MPQAASLCRFAYSDSLLLLADRPFLPFPSHWPATFTLPQFLVPRQSYLHSVVPRALALLQHLLPPGELAPWFEHGHLPLKW